MERVQGRVQSTTRGRIRTVLLDLPIEWNGRVYYLPLELIMPLVAVSIIAVWYWHKLRVSKRFHTFILKLEKSGLAQVFKPTRELNTMVHYTDEQGVEQRPFKPFKSYLDTSESTKPESAGAATPSVQVKRSSVTFITPIGWQERIAVHPEGSSELFDWSKCFEDLSAELGEEQGSGRLLQEAADTFSSLKERLKLGLRENWFLILMMAIAFGGVGFIMGLYSAGRI